MLNQGRIWVGFSQKLLVFGSNSCLAEIHALDKYLRCI